MNYGIEYEGKAYGPAGLIKDPEGRSLAASDMEAYNKALEAKEIELLKSGPDRVFAYVKYHPVRMSNHVNPNSLMRETITSARWSVGTWLGTEICSDAVVGPRAYTGFGFRGHTYRRPVTCRIFGVLYHGWYFESSGDYCRLKRAKRQ